MAGRAWTELAPGVRVCHSQLYATASTVVTAHGRALVVDPAWLPSEFAGLADDLTGAGLEAVAGFATHAHFDHLLWHPGLGTAPRFASSATVAEVAEHRDELVAQLGEGWPDELVGLLGRIDPLPAGGLLAPATDDGIGADEWGEVDLIVHDAHAVGHTALWLGEHRVLLAGDMLSDIELPLPRSAASGLADYDAALEVLRPYVERAAVLVPGHGTPTTEPQRRWDADRRYLDSLLAGTESDDPRLQLPDGAEAHAANRALVAAG